MENDRRYYANCIQDEIRALEGYVRQNRATIRRFNTNVQNSIIVEKIRNLEIKINEHEMQIEEKSVKITEIRRGNYDEHIKLMKNNAKKDAERKHNATMRIKKEKADEKSKRRAESTRIFRSQREQDYNNRRQKRNYEYDYKRYKKICSGIPDYLYKNLSTMPNNKGYIWRDVWLFGQLDPEPGRPQVMFERKNKDLLYIHEYDQKEKRIYEKRGKNRKVLVERKPRKTIPISHISI